MLSQKKFCKRKYFITKKEPRRCYSYGVFRNCINYFTAFFNKAPALNLGALEAAILISFPVAGLRPLRAARFATANGARFHWILRMVQRRSSGLPIGIR